MNALIFKTLKTMNTKTDKPGNLCHSSHPHENQRILDFVENRERSHNLCFFVASLYECHHFAGGGGTNVGLCLQSGLLNLAKYLKRELHVLAMLLVSPLTFHNTK